MTLEPGFTVLKTSGPLTKLGPYKLLRVLGKGGNSLVYLARHALLDKLFALKTLESGGPNGDERSLRFRREARLIAELHHPSIVSVHEIGAAHGVEYLAMEHLQGETLDRWIRSQEKPRAWLLPISRLCRAVAYAHRQGVVHRDLKPANVMMVPGRGPVILDFGLAKDLEEADDLTRTGWVYGTPHFMAPEQARGWKHAIGPRTDIYALGAILRLAATGRPPYEGAGFLEVVAQVAKEDPVPPRQVCPSLSCDLERVMLRAMARRPEDRYADADEMAEDLLRIHSGRPVAGRGGAMPATRVRAPGVPAVARVATQGRGRRLPAVAAALGAAALVVGVGAWTWPSRPPTRPGTHAIPTAAVRPTAVRDAAADPVATRVPATLEAVLCDRVALETSVTPPAPIEPSVRPPVDEDLLASVAPVAPADPPASRPGEPPRDARSGVAVDLAAIEAAVAARDFASASDRVERTVRTAGWDPSALAAWRKALTAAREVEAAAWRLLVDPGRAHAELRFRSSPADGRPDFCAAVRILPGFLDANGDRCVEFELQPGASSRRPFRDLAAASIVALARRAGGVGRDALLLYPCLAAEDGQAVAQFLEAPEVDPDLRAWVEALRRRRLALAIEVLRDTRARGDANDLRARLAEIDFLLAGEAPDPAVDAARREALAFLEGESRTSLAKKLLKSLAGAVRDGRADRCENLLAELDALTAADLEPGDRDLLARARTLVKRADLHERLYVVLLPGLRHGLQARDLAGLLWTVGEVEAVLADLIDLGRPEQNAELDSCLARARRLLEKANRRLLASGGGGSMPRIPGDGSGARGGEVSPAVGGTVATGGSGPTGGGGPTEGGGTTPAAPTPPGPGDPGPSGVQVDVQIPGVGGVSIGAGS